MERYLWQNKKLYVWKVEGTITNLVAGHREPEDIQYRIYSAFRPRAKQRGTMYGNPSFFENYDTFYGSIRYNTISIETKSGDRMRLKDVIVTKKFQAMIAIGSTCELYLISAYRSGEGTLLFALRANGTQIEDLNGVGSLVESMQASIMRQLKFMIVPVIVSLIVFGSIGLFTVSSLQENIPDFPLKPIIAILTIGTFLFIVSAGAGMSIMKKKLQVFPSRSALKNILVREGFSL
jgi:hypothetical protein